MKSFIALLAALIFSLMVNAQEETNKFQIEEGSWSLGGLVSIGGGNREDVDMDPYQNSNSFGFILRPEVGYFISDNFALGLSIGYSYARTKYDGEELRDKSIRHGVMFSPYVRKFIPISPKLAFALMGSLNYRYDQYKNIGDRNLDKTEINTYGVNLRPGFSYLLSNRLTLDATIGNVYYSYMSQHDNGREDFSRSNYGLDLSSNIFLGIRYYIN